MEGLSVLTPGLGALVLMAERGTERGLCSIFDACGVTVTMQDGFHYGIRILIMFVVAT